MKFLGVIEPIKSKYCNNVAIYWKFVNITFFRYWVLFQSNKFFKIMNISTPLRKWVWFFSFYHRGHIIITSDCLEMFLTFVATYWKWTIMQTRTRLVHVSNTVSSPNIDNMHRPDRNETALYWKLTGLQWNNLASDRNQ